MRHWLYFLQSISFVHLSYLFCHIFYFHYFYAVLFCWIGLVNVSFYPILAQPCQTMVVSLGLHSYIYEWVLRDAVKSHAEFQHVTPPKQSVMDVKNKKILRINSQWIKHIIRKILCEIVYTLFDLKMKNCNTSFCYNLLTILFSQHTRSFNYRFMMERIPNRFSLEFQRYYSDKKKTV